MSEPVIHITHTGNMANRMFQYMFAKFLQKQIPRSIVAGLYIPDLMLGSATPAAIPDGAVTLEGHHPRIDKVIYAANHGLINCIRLRGFFQNLIYYPDRHSICELFAGAIPASAGYDKSHLVINIRANEILNDLHKGYFPLPNAYYKHLIEKTGLKPVFMGQISGDTQYHHNLRSDFPDAIYHSNDTALDDFSTILHSKNIAISISSFSWLAAWLSDADRIFMPIGGFLDPVKRNDVNLLPVSDPRYEFYTMSRHVWDSQSMSHVRLTEAADIFSPLSRDETRALVRHALLA